MKKILIVFGGIVTLSSSVAHAKECKSGEDFRQALINAKSQIQGNLLPPKDIIAPLSIPLNKNDVVMTEQNITGMKKCIYKVGNIEIAQYHTYIHD